MKKNNVLGIDIGQSRLKLALVSGGSVKKTASAEMPEGALRDGRPEPPEMIADLIKTTMKENGIHSSLAALVISGENVYINHIDMPVMTADQLKQNLPFEFSDFIDGNPKNYVFDYINTNEGIDNTETETGGEDSEEKAEHMSLLGVASPVEYMDLIKDMLKRAGLKLFIAAPELSAYASIIRERGDHSKVAGGEYGFVDLGYTKIQIYMFKKTDFMTSRELEWGMQDITSAIAEEMGVDIHTAHTYLDTNYENCLDLENVRNRMDLMAIELKRSLDFYRFSNPESTLTDIYITGGGAYLSPLIDSIKNELTDITIHSADELLPELASEGNSNLFLKAAGIAMNQ